MKENKITHITEEELKEALQNAFISYHRISLSNSIKRGLARKKLESNNK